VDGRLILLFNILCVVGPRVQSVISKSVDYTQKYQARRTRHDRITGRASECLQQIGTIKLILVVIGSEEKSVTKLRLPRRTGTLYTFMQQITF